MRTEVLTIRHEAGRFVAEVGSDLAYISYRELDERVLDFDHTFVPKPLRGGGIASQLTEHALEFARVNGFRVVPSCPFVAVYIARHPKYRELLADHADAIPVAAKHRSTRRL